MTETADITTVLVVEERVDRDLGYDEDFFSTHIWRRHRVRPVAAEELPVAMEAYFPSGWLYAAVALLPQRRSRLFFKCSRELRENLSEKEAAEIFADLLALQRAAVSPGGAH